jgi:O-antigen/teichoic acid export membrane protein
MTSAFAILMPPLAGGAAIGGPILVRLMLPRYVPCIGALQVFMVSVVFLAVPLALRTALIAKNREVEIMVWQGLGGLLIGGSVALLIRQHASLAQLALAGACGLFLAGLAIIVRGLQALDLAPGQVARYLLGWAIPLGYCVLLLWGLKALLPRWFGLRSPLVSDVVSLPIFIVLNAPLAWVAERTTGIIRKARAGGGVVPSPSEEAPDSLPSDGANGRL